LLFAIALAQSCPSNTCPSGATCCELSDGSFGCCPYVNALCCSDRLHCCPSGYACDLQSGQCNKNAGFVGIAGQTGEDSLKLETVKPSPDASCPAGTCPSGDTCCQLSDGSFGCCPYPNADCCTDHAHCCPNGYTCDLSTGQCVKGAGLTGVVIVKKLVDLKAVAAGSCPAGTCPAKNTCCAESNGEWGCCPYPNADCCSDHEHCCPSGYACNLKSGQCDKKASMTGVIVTKNLVDLKPALAASCPAGTCPSGDTCCQLSDGSYGCCPYPNADCCSDHAHCCPNGYTCDLGTGQCTKGSTMTQVKVKIIKLLKPEEAL